MTKATTLESEMTKKCHLVKLDLPTWMWEVAESEAKILTQGNLDRLISRYIMAHFNRQRRGKENFNQTKK